MTKEYIYKGQKAEIKYEINWGLSMDYGTSLVKLHPEIKWHSETIGSYQGDIISIGVNKKGEWYYKNNSYGSCSGCDWVQGIYSKEEAEEFFKNQETIINLGKDKEIVKEYLRKEKENCWDFEKENLDNLFKFIDNN